MITIKGKSREIEVSRASYAQHEKYIWHFVDGGDLKCKHNTQWRYEGVPSFHPEEEYIIKQREAIPGEVWKVDGMALIKTKQDGLKYYVLEGHMHGSIAELANHRGLEYSAPSIEAYYARKALCPASGDSDSDIAVNLVELAKLK